MFADWNREVFFVWGSLESSFCGNGVVFSYTTFLSKSGLLRCIRRPAGYQKTPFLGREACFMGGDVVG